MNYSAVAPPSQSGNFDPQSAFADALARARQIAAKINQPNAEQETAALKRPYDGADNQPEAKKMNTMEQSAMADPIGAQLRAIADQHRAQAAQAAATAAAQINAKLGIASTPQGPPTSAPSINSPAPMVPHAPVGGGMVETEEYQVPDRMVGLIIGKGGEQIAAIQAETGCRVQFAPDSGGMLDRPCTLTGAPETVIKAKEMIDRIIAKGQGMPDPMTMGDGATMVEILIPGNKVGLVIGKGGETIKQLQEKANVKMVMIQDSNQPTNHDKPLRITGEPMKCQRAKDMVMELLAQKDQGNFGTNDYGSGPRGGAEIPVPRSLVGVVIGKGGEMIKKIQSETGAKVQFKPDDGRMPERLCSVTGPPDKVQEAANMIQDLVQNARQNDMAGGPMGRGRGRGRGDGRFNDRGGPGGGMDRFGGGFPDETTFTVPAEKCGLVIGKGGETIRDINNQTGALVQLSRQNPPNPRERVFNLKGNPDQIEHAIRLICEKAGLPPPPQNQGPGGPSGHGGPPGPGGPGGPGPGTPGPPQQGGFNQFGQYNQFNQPAQQSPPCQPPHQGMNNPAWSGAQAWSQAEQPQPNKQNNDANAAAWAAYYAQYYGQNQQQQPQQPQQQQQQPPQQPPQAAQPQGQQPNQQQQPASYPAPAVNPQTGQPDYSAAWAEYYRQQGMHYHAQAIMSQSQSQSGGQQPPQQPQ